MKGLICCICLLIISNVSAQQEAEKTITSGSAQNVSAHESDFWNVVKDRRSVRKFKADSIPEADIIKIIDAARMAPTSGNQQPWKFLVIRDQKKIAAMKDACINGVMQRFEERYNKNESKEKYLERVTNNFANYFSAPVYIVVLTDNNSTYPDYNHWDGPMAAGYLMLAARALGYGTVFITDAISEKVTKDVLQIPDSFTRVCITPLGVPVEWPKSPEKKKLEDFISFEKL